MIKVIIVAGMKGSWPIRLAEKIYIQLSSIMEPTAFQTECRLFHPEAAPHPADYDRLERLLSDGNTKLILIYGKTLEDRTRYEQIYSQLNHNPNVSHDHIISLFMENNPWQCNRNMGLPSATGYIGNYPQQSTLDYWGRCYPNIFIIVPVPTL